MPWRMIIFLLILAVVVFFAGFNITNVSDISFGFYTVKDVPIFISLFVSFLVGTLVTLPFVVGKRRKKSQKTPKQVGEEPLSTVTLDEIPPIPEIDEPTKKQ